MILVVENKCTDMSSLNLSNCGDEPAIFQLPNYISNGVMARGNVSRYGNKVENRANRRSEVSRMDMGSTTIESVSKKKDLGE